MPLNPLKSLFVGIFCGIIIFVLLSLIDLVFWGALFGFLASGAVMTLLKGDKEEVTIYFKILPGVLMSVFVLIFIIFTQKYYAFYESIGLVFLFIIYLLMLSFLGGLLSALGSKLAKSLFH